MAVCRWTTHEKQGERSLRMSLEEGGVDAHIREFLDQFRGEERDPRSGPALLQRFEARRRSRSMRVSA